MSGGPLSDAQEEQITTLRALKGKKRKAAITTLLNGDDGWQALSALQSDEDKAIRKLAVETLETFGEAPPSEVYEALERALEDPESSVRTAALKRLEVTAPQGVIAVKLLTLLPNKKARETLAAYGTTAFPALTDALGKGDAKARKHIIETFAAMGDAVKDSEAAKDALFATLSDADKGVRTAAFAALETLGIQAVQSKEALLAALQQGDENAATNVKAWGEDALEAFEALLSSDNPKIRKFALVHMVDLISHLEADDDYEALIGALDDPKPAVRRAALDFFAALPFAVEDALEAIDKLYDEPAAIKVLLKYGEDAIPTYKDLMRSHSPKDRRTFLSILPKLKAHTVEKIAEPLLQMAKQEYDHEALMTLFAAIPKLTLPKDDIIAAIDRHMDSWDRRISQAACEVLAPLGHTTRASTWEQCRLADAVKRHLYRLGATFTPTVPRTHKGEIDQRMNDPIYDLMYGVQFPHTSHFRTFDAFGDTYISRDSWTFSAETRRGGEPATCVQFAETDYRKFGLPLDIDNKDSDPTVYYSEDNGDEGHWVYSSLSYFLQHFERPKDL